MKQSDLKVSEKRQARKEKSKRRKKASRQIWCGFCVENSLSKV